MTNSILDPEFVALMHSFPQEALFQMFYEVTPNQQKTILALTGDAQAAVRIISILNTFGLSLTVKKNAINWHNTWPFCSRVPAAMHMVARALAYQASLDPKFKDFTSLDTIQSQLQLMEKCFEQHEFVLEEFRLNPY